MRDGDYLVFVEVKYRHSARFGGSIEQVGARKRERLTLTALHYLAEHGGRPQPACRFDVVGIEGDGGDCNTHWVKNAFEP